jgi:copper ion binding protein
MGILGKKEVEKRSFTVEGMTCEHCQQTVEEGLKALSGVTSVKVNLKKKRAQIVYDPQSVSLEEVSRKVEELGYHADIR